MEMRTAWWQEDDTLTWNGIALGDPGGDSSVVLLAQLKLDATVGSDALEATDGGDIIVTVGGVNYVVQPALLRHVGGGRLDDSFLFLGVATTAAPKSASDDEPPAEESPAEE